MNLRWPDDYIGKVICGDCLEVLRGIPDGAVDLVVTDPPYAVSMSGVTHQRQPGKGTKRFDFFPGDDDWKAVRDKLVAPAIAEVRRALKDTGTIYCWCSHRLMGSIVDQLEDNGFRTRPFGWRKLVVPPAPPYTGWSTAFELCVYATRPGRTWNQKQAIMPNLVDSDSLRHGNPNKNGHPTQKPIEVIAPQIVASSHFDEIILDPFCGSGTTLVAAKQLGRRFIGIEINPDYCKITEDRLRQEELFGRGVA